MRCSQMRMIARSGPLARVIPCQGTRRPKEVPSGDKASAAFGCNPKGWPGLGALLRYGVSRGI